MAWILTYSKSLCVETERGRDAPLKPASPEQRAVVEAVARGASVVVEACAGAGKTTAALHVARSVVGPTLVSTIHALFGRLYLPGHAGVVADADLRRIVLEDLPMRPAAPCAVLVLDEAQDLNAVRFAAVCKLARDAGGPQLVLVGDPRQTVCAYQGADHRFLTLAPEALGGAWERLPLGTSWRLTAPMAAYVNEACAYAGSHAPIRVAARGALPVVAFRGETYRCVHEATELIVECLRRGYRPDDVLVLAVKTSYHAAPAAARRSETPLQRLVSGLCERDVPVHLRADERDRAADARLMRGKVLVSTIVAAKGTQRKVVVVLDHNAAYFRYYARAEPPELCTCAQHVALTRASELLVLCYNDAEPAFVRPDALERRGLLRVVRYERPTGRPGAELPERPTAVTALLAHVDDDDLARLEARLEWRRVRERADRPIELPGLVELGAACESVCEANGIALPALLDLGWLRRRVEEMAAQPRDRYLRARACALRDGAPDTPPPALAGAEPEWRAALRWALEAAALSRAWPDASSGFLCHYKQLQHSGFAWLPVEQAHRVVAALRDALDEPETLELEAPRVREDLCGRIDACTARTLYEFKCTAGALTAAHKLQLAAYAWLDGAPRRRAVLLNALSGETWELLSSAEALDGFVRELRALHARAPPAMPDAEFVALARRLASRDVGHDDLRRPAGPED
jgi:hypothetical protein